MVLFDESSSNEEFDMDKDKEIAMICCCAKNKRLSMGV
jgi:hypothetical protein